MEPAISFVTADAGGRTTVSFVYKNQTSTDVTVDVAAADVRRRSGEHAGVTFAPIGEGERGAGAWLRVDAPTFDLAAGTERTIRIGIDVPTAAGAGGHYGGLTFTAHPQRPAGQVDLGARVEVPVLITVPGDARRAVDLTIEPDDRVRWSGGELAWRVRAHNAGDLHENLTGAVVSIDGALTPAQSRPLDLGILLPGETRTRTVHLSVREAPDLLRATVRAPRDAGADPVTGTAAPVAIVPWWSLAVLVIASIVVRRRLRRRGGQ